MPTAYVTTPPSHADEIASTLVEERLAACVNRVECTSTFRWEGDVVDEEEAILLAKTTEDRAGALIERVKEVHPYEVPCVELFEESSVSEAFSQWRVEATKRE
jgi:periplasmic divalent cation tolerance protein